MLFITISITYIYIYIYILEDTNYNGLTVVFKKLLIYLLLLYIYLIYYLYGYIGNSI